MKKVYPIILCGLMLTGCAVGINQNSVIIPPVDGKKTFAVTGQRLYTTDDPPKNAALRYVAQTMAGVCPNGVVPTKDFEAGLSPNWAGVNHLYWSGPIHCKE